MHAKSEFLEKPFHLLHVSENKKLSIKCIIIVVTSYCPLKCWNILIFTKKEKLLYIKLTCVKQREEACSNLNLKFF